MLSTALTVLTALLLSAPTTVLAQGVGRGGAPKTLVAVLAHADDEAPVAPILARYAREGVRVYLLIASDGSQGTGFASARGETLAPGQELANVRVEEARCAAQALGTQPPILLSFPDGKLGDYVGDRSLIFRLTQQIAEHLQRLQPDVVLTWGPDGGVGHPDHRIVSNVVTQLQRAGAPGVPERVFYMYLPAEGIQAVSPRGVPPLLIPAAKYFTARVPFTPEDLQASLRSMVCHKSQFTPEAVQRLEPIMARAWNGTIALVPAFTSAPLKDLFR